MGRMWSLAREGEADASKHAWGSNWMSVRLGEDHSAGAERPARRATDHQLQIEMAVRKAKEVDHVEGGLELRREQRRVLGSHPKSHQGSCVAKHGVPNVWIKLMEMLVGERK